MKHIYTAICRTLVFMFCLIWAAGVQAQYVQTGSALLDKTAQGSDLQATNVAVSANGQMAIAGYQHRQHNSGGFDIYQRTGNQWSTIFSFTGYPGYEMGCFTAISADGSTVSVGIHPTLTGYPVDSFWIFKRNGNNWELQQQIPGSYAPSMSYNGNVIATGNNIWECINNVWRLTYSAPIYFTFQVSGDGNTILNGGTEVYVRNGNTWVQQAVLNVVVTGDTTLHPTVYGNPMLAGNGNVTGVFSSYGLYDYLATYRRTGNTWIQDTNLIVLPNGSSPGFFSYDGNTYTYLEQFSFINFGPVTYKFNGLNWFRDSTTTGWNVQNYNSGQGGKNSGSAFSTPGMAIDSSCTIVLLYNPISDTLLGGLKEFNFSNNQWSSSTPALINNAAPGNGLQGSSTVISADGSTLVFSGRKNNYGTVWVYSRNGFNWNQQTVLQCPDGNSSDWLFGLDGNQYDYSLVTYPYTLALSANGNVLAVASPNAYVYDSVTQYYTNWGKVYLYNRSGSTWSYDTTLLVSATPVYYNHFNFFASSVALSNDGATLLVGTSNDGAYAYAKSGGNWLQQGHLLVSAGNGSSKVALTPGGDTALVTEEQYNNEQGAVHIYIRNGSSWTLNRCCLYPSQVTGTHAFPAAMAISANGQYIAGSIAGTDGEIYVYSYATNQWNGPLPAYTSFPQGLSIWLSQGGDTLMQISDVGQNPLYLANIWVRSDTTWTDVYDLPEPYENDNDLVPVGNFTTNGTTISVTPDKKYIVYGVPNANYNDGGVYIYQYSNLTVTRTDSTSPSCAVATNGKLKIKVTGGVAPVNITWSTGATGLDSITNLAPGTYTVSITDADSVQVVRQYTLSPKSNMVTNYPASYIPCMPGTTGTITASVTGGSSPYSYRWNTLPVQTTATVSILNSGTYIYTATDALGCVVSDSANIQLNTVSSAYWADVTGTQPNCGNNGNATAVFNGSTGNVTYAWSNGSLSGIDTMLGPGTYTVSVMDVAGCSATGSISMGSFCENVIRGRAYYDVNNNCTYNLGTDVPASYNVYASQGGYYAYGNTDSVGNYQILLPGTGTFNVYIYNWSTCGFGLCTGANYPPQVVFTTTGDTAVVDFPIIDTAYDLAVGVTAPVFNPGYNGNVTIYYGNLKSQHVANVILIFTYDTSMHFVSVMPSANATVDTVNHIITWHIDTVYPGLNQYVNANFVISTSASGPYVLVSSTITAPGNDCNPANNYSTIGVPFASAIDPNEKTSQLTDSVEQYAIYFQNTGTDSTHFVLVSDTLSPYLEPASLQTLAASSHNYTFSLAGNGIVQWRFDPYLLPDSAIDPVNSRGYVMFSAKIKSNTAANAQISNTGYIYFDYNTAVVTNTVTNTLQNLQCNLVTTTINDTICSGDTVYIGNHAYTSTGNYIDSFTITGGCDSIVTLNLTVNPLPAVTLSWVQMVQQGLLHDIGDVISDTGICLQQHASTIALGGGTPTGGTFSGEYVVNDTLLVDSFIAHPQLGDIDTITYTIHQLGCASSGTDNIFIDICGGIEQITANNFITIYPNPASTQLFIKTENIQPQTIAIYDVDGRMITTQPYKPEIDINQLSLGVYFIEVQSNDEMGRKMFVKM